MPNKRSKNFEFSFAFMKFVIDNTITIEDALKSAGIKLQKFGLMNCCFHNDRTPSAKYFGPTEGCSGGHIHCFAEQKRYKSSDALEKLNVVSTPEIFRDIWSKISEEKKSMHLQEFEIPQSYMTPEFRKFLDSTSPSWKAGKIRVSELLQSLVDSSKSEE